MSAPSRQKSLVFPREHGAWGILLVPLVTGGAVGLLNGGGFVPLIPLTVLALALFWLRTPVESWMGAAVIRARNEAEFRLVRKAAVALAAVSAAALIWLCSVTRMSGLVWIGAVAAIGFVLQAGLKQFRNARIASQMVGAAGLTATGPAAYYAATGRLDATAWAIWAANLLFAVNQIHFVQMRIHAARSGSASARLAEGRGFLVSQVVQVAIVVTACTVGFFHWMAAIGFVPLFCRGFAWFAFYNSKPLAIHSLGKRELYYACAFGLLLVIGFQFR